MTPDELDTIVGRSETFPNRGQEDAWIADAFLDRLALIAEVRALQNQIATIDDALQQQIQSILAGRQR